MKTTDDSGSATGGDDRWISAYLDDLRKRHLFRETRSCPSAGGKWMRDGREYLNFGTNDYLGLSTNPAVKASAAAFIERYGCGAGASRLMTGTFDCHFELERRLALLKGSAACLVFASGHAANTGTIQAVAGHGDSVFVDRLAHASILDGVILSRADMHRFEHNNPDDLDARLKRTPLSRCRLVVTESVFSMDGDVAPVREIAAVARRHDAVLMVDEAHATGIFGPRGAGVVALEGAEQDVHIRMGTLSKALGSQGGFVCGSVPLRDLLVNRARSFVYSTGLPPPAVGAALASLDWIDANPGAGVELLTRAGVFRKRLVEAGINTGNSGSQIVPVIVGDEVRAMSMSERLLKDGFLVPAVRPPTVPAGTARLRFSVTLAHSSSDLERTAEAVIRCARDGGTC